jgi:hypothetical protein
LSKRTRTSMRTSMKMMIFSLILSARKVRSRLYFTISKQKYLKYQTENSTVKYAVKTFRNLPLFTAKLVNYGPVIYPCTTLAETTVPADRSAALRRHYFVHSL